MVTSWRRSLFWDRFQKICTLDFGEKICTSELPKSKISVVFDGFRWFLMIFHGKIMNLYFIRTVLRYYLELGAGILIRNR